MINTQADLIGRHNLERCTLCRFFPDNPRSFSEKLSGFCPGTAFGIRKWRPGRVFPFGSHNKHGFFRTGRRSKALDGFARQTDAFCSHSCATERARLHRPVMYLFSPYVSLRYIDRSTAGSYSASFCRITSLQYTVKILYLLQLMHWKVFTLLFIINAFSFFFSRTHYLLRLYRFSSHISDN